MPLCEFCIVKSKIMRQIALTIALFLASNVFAQSKTAHSKFNHMKLNAGIITSKLAETKEFYTKTLNFGVTFENEFYLLMHTPGKEAEISFLLPNHPSQQPIFQAPFQNQGVYLTIEVDDVDSMYKELKEKGTDIKIDIRDEPWGDRHFAIQDPNGVGIDIVTYSQPEN